MRIAFLHRSLAGGGTEADLRRMASGLVARGHAVTVFCAKPRGAPEGVAVRRVPVVRAGRLLRLLSFALLAPRLAASEPWDVVVGFGRTLRQDVVRVGGGTHRSYLARMEADGFRAAARGPYHRAILALERRMFAPGAYRRVLTVSALAADEVVHDYAVPRARVAVVYNGVDLVRFDPAARARLGPPLRAALGIAADRRVCAAVGSGFVRKGFDLLLELWATQAPPATVLVLVGDDERLGRWRRRAAAPELAGRVVVTGPRADVEAVYALADAVCVPSRQEAFGNVVLEACAAGVPVVTTRRAGAAELLDGPLATLVVASPDDRAVSPRPWRALGPERAGPRRRGAPARRDAHLGHARGGGGAGARGGGACARLTRRRSCTGRCAPGSHRASGSRTRSGPTAIRTGC
ncbi:MAG: glycosyltransferase family 4 protein [bacterium]|nr:glycosyltransferase family 4 protein [bacterium]